MGEGGGGWRSLSKKKLSGGLHWRIQLGGGVLVQKKSPDLRSTEIGISAVCSVNSNILLTVHVAFIILQKLDFSRLALDVYVSTRYGYNIKKFRSKGDTTKQWSLSTFQNLIRFLKILCLFDSETWDSCQERVKFTRFILR